MTRIEAARRKVRIAKVAVGITAAAGLAVFAGLARAAHPGTHASSAATSATSSSQQSSFGDDYFGSGGSTIGPSGSASPQLQSGGS
jgi:hypothetical protein